MAGEGIDGFCDVGPAAGCGSRRGFLRRSMREPALAARIARRSAPTSRSSAGRRLRTASARRCHSPTERSPAAKRSASTCRSIWLVRCSSNLTTPAGASNHWSDAEFFRAIRNAVGATSGRWLVIMSITNAGKLSDEDIHALIAYIRKLPAPGAAMSAPEPPIISTFSASSCLASASFQPASGRQRRVTSRCSRRRASPSVRRIHPVVPGLPGMSWQGPERRRRRSLAPSDRPRAWLRAGAVRISSARC